MTENELYHFGVKGMHWGIRRQLSPQVIRERAIRNVKRRAITTGVNLGLKGAAVGIPKAAKIIRKPREKLASHAARVQREELRRETNRRKHEKVFGYYGESGDSFRASNGRRVGKPKNMGVAAFRAFEGTRAGGAALKGVSKVNTFAYGTLGRNKGYWKQVENRVNQEVKAVRESNEAHRRAKRDSRYRDPKYRNLTY